MPNETVRDPDTILNDAYGRFREKIKRAMTKVESFPPLCWRRRTGTGTEKSRIGKSLGVSP